MSRFAVSDVEVDVPSVDLPKGDNGSSTPPKAMPEDVKMDYLAVGGFDPKSNVDRNQVTVTSTASGNMALYYEVGGANGVSEGVKTGSNF